MSKNPYFAHLPTWRNRQDLAYALDNLPRILETMTASSPLIATYSYPSTSQSASLSTSPLSSSMSPSSSSTPSPSSTYNSSVASSSSVQSQFGSSPSHSTASGRTSPAVFRERFMLDLAKECQKSHSQSYESSTHSTPYVPQCVSSSSAYITSASTTNTSSNSNANGNGYSNNTFYPLQFSTRAKAMAYLIEILQSLQKEPCGCDLTKGCYCGIDGIEDHEGKSPCYVCGEWFPDRRDNTSGEQAQTQGQDQGQGQYGHRQGRAWHEQGSLRHHVAESRVKKWLETVFRPPLTPATSPEQENVIQFGHIGQEDLLQQGRQYQYQNISNITSWNQPLSENQFQQRMEPGRPWSFHDIELEARSKSRSRQNSTSSNSSSSWSSHCYSSPQQINQPQEALGSSYNSGSGAWKCLASPKPMDAASPPHLSMQSLPQPWTPTSPSRLTSMEPSAASCQPRARTLSCSDSHQGRIFSASSLPFTPLTTRPRSCHGGRQSAPIRPSSTHSTTFAIPQEILDPNYKSPTFRIKSWNPPSPHPSALTPLPVQVDTSGLERMSQPAKQTLDDWTVTTETQPETVTKSSLLKASVDQYELDGRCDDKAPAPMAEQQRNTCETASVYDASSPVEKTPNVPFRFSFTSERFRAAVEASIEKTTAAEISPCSSAVVEDSHKDEVDQTPLDAVVTTNSILQSAICPELKIDEEPHSDDPTISVISREVDTDAVRVGTSANIISAPSSNSSTPISASFQSVPITITLDEEIQTQEGDDAAGTLVSKFTEMDLASPLSPKLDSKSYRSEIRKTAPMSPLYPSSFGKGLLNALSPASSCSSPRFSTTPTSPMSPSGDNEGGVHKTGSWTSLHRLVRKMTRGNDTVMASLPRSGRIQIEGS
ncbi:hypothetical protein BGZ46_002082 [Entomortierella lignicola]|nr:hypothetical protein BGZ46_002082 [Entomortierella lignicola]